MPVNKVKSQKLKVKIAAQKSKVDKGLSIDVFDTKGKVVESMMLHEEIFGAKVNKTLISQAVRVYLANQRRGTVSTKTRGQVQGSTRKIYRQKGTGRARHGGIRAPIFVHGGLAHGPTPRDYSLDFPKKMKKQALFSALSAVYKDGGLKIVAGLEKVKPKTKEMAKVLDSLAGDKKKRKILLVTPVIVASITQASRNIAGVTLMAATHLNTYEILRNNVLLCTKDAIDTIASHFLKKE